MRSSWNVALSSGCVTCAFLKRSAAGRMKRSNLRRRRRREGGARKAHGERGGGGGGGRGVEGGEWLRNVGARGCEGVQRPEEQAVRGEQSRVFGEGGSDRVRAQETRDGEPSPTE
eukprot:629100-Pleurochrysis_carterae.AAC.1